MNKKLLLAAAMTLIFASIACGVAKTQRTETIVPEKAGETTLAELQTPANTLAFADEATLAPESTEQAELEALLDQINQDVELATAGSYLKAVGKAVALMDWGIDTDMTSDSIRCAVVEWMMNKGNDELVEFSEKLTVVDQAYVQLLGDDAKDLLDSAGYEGYEQRWGSEPIEAIETLMYAVGLRS